MNMMDTNNKLIHNYKMMTFNVIVMSILKK